MTENKSKIMSIICGSEQQPLILGGIKVPCFVIEGGVRVVTENGIVEAIGYHYGGTGYKKANGDPYIVGFLKRDNLLPFMQEINPLILDVAMNPIKFQLNGKGKFMIGYEALFLADICDGILKARDENTLASNQSKYAERASILMRAFARTGLVALIDEVTGYEKFKEQKSLQKILDSFLDSVIHKWIKTFHDDFYINLHRIRGIEYNSNSTRRPPYLGHLTNDIIYSRLAPGVLEALKETVDKDESGNRKYRFHQALTRKIGHPELTLLIHGVTALMKVSPHWDSFYTKLEQAYPRYGNNLSLPFAPVDDDHYRWDN